MSSELEDAKKNIENQILKLNEQVEEIKKKPKQNAYDKRRLIMIKKKVRRLVVQKKNIEIQINALERSIRQSTIMKSNRPLSLAPSSARGSKVSKREDYSRRHISRIDNLARSKSKRHYSTPYIPKDPATQTVMNYCDELREQSSNNDQFNSCYEDLYKQTIDIIEDPSSDEAVINNAKLHLKKLIMQLDNNISEEDIDIDKIVDQIKGRNNYAGIDKIVDQIKGRNNYAGPPVNSTSVRSPQNSTSVRSPQRWRPYYDKSITGLHIRKFIDQSLGPEKNGWRRYVGLKKAPYIITNKKKRKRQIKHSKRHKKYPKPTKKRS